MSDEPVVNPEETTSGEPAEAVKPVDNPSAAPRPARSLADRIWMMAGGIVIVALLALVVMLGVARAQGRPLTLDDVLALRFMPTATLESGSSLLVEENPGSGGPSGLIVEPPASAFPAISDLTDIELPITRQALLHTTIPSRPRVDVITYTVKQGDTLFLIADNYGIKPETLLWGNFDVLEDNPHLLRPDQVLNILPVDGTYYEWAEGDSLQTVADFFETEPSAILEYPGNRFDLSEVEAGGEVAIEPGTMLIVPGGRRAIKDWGPPAISRSNPAAARYYGAGHCGSIYSGAIGNGWFVWPTTARSISGYTYTPGVHPAIDIAGATGNAVYATDSGVIVYAGWSNYGYGNLVVVDHGNGWQSAYAHLDTYSAVCGQSVFQGSVIGAVGNTGNSYGSHLHFELVYNGAKLNPLDYLQ